MSRCCCLNGDHISDLRYSHTFGVKGTYVGMSVIPDALATRALSDTGLLGGHFFITLNNIRSIKHVFVQWRQTWAGD